MSARNTLANKKIRREARVIRHDNAPHPTHRVKPCQYCGKARPIPVNERYCKRCIRRAVCGLFPAPKWNRRFRG